MQQKNAKVRDNQIPNGAFFEVIALTVYADHVNKPVPLSPMAGISCADTPSLEPVRQRHEGNEIANRRETKLESPM